MEGILYKYLDAEGGAAMLFNKNLMFTNATQLNDLFDCHQNLVDYSNATPDRTVIWDKRTIEGIEVNRAERQRNGTWVCSLSQVHNSLLMWAFYGKNHQGVCIGIDTKKAKKYLDRIIGLFIGCIELKVQYQDIRKRPDFFRDKKDLFTYQLSTKAKEWAYEREVRLVSINPSRMFMKLLPSQADKEVYDGWKEFHVFADLGGECFESLYFGANIESYKREKIMEFARKANPNIKIYQMTPDPEAFKLKEELIK